MGGWLVSRRPGTECYIYILIVLRAMGFLPQLRFVHHESQHLQIPAGNSQFCGSVTHHPCPPTRRCVILQLDPSLSPFFLAVLNPDAIRNEHEKSAIAILEGRFVVLVAAAVKCRRGGDHELRQVVMH